MLLDDYLRFEYVAGILELNDFFMWFSFEHPQEAFGREDTMKNSISDEYFSSSDIQYCKKIEEEKWIDEFIHQIPEKSDKKIERYRRKLY